MEMKIIRYLFIWVSFSVWSQSNGIMENEIVLGETTLTIYHQIERADENITFLNVHEDETTSIEALEAYIKIEPINYFRLKHKETRRVAFTLGDESYSVDPNRIFTRKGRKNTLKDGGKYSSKAAKEVKKLANQILERIPENHAVIAMHNNTDVNYSIESYLPGGDEAENTADIHISEKWDADDFIYTTDRAYFEAFKKLDLNVILQDNKNYVNDGSLSVYCGKRGIRYVNIETQKGHFDEQMNLIAMVLGVVRSI